MGFFGDYSNPSQIKKEVIAGMNHNKNINIIDSKSTNYSKHLWVLIENKELQEKTILMFLMRKLGKQNWTYKPLSETVGPCYYDCPLSLIKQASKTNSKFANIWREKVKNYHDQKRK